MKTKFWAIALVIVCTLFTAAGQFFYKKGASVLSFSFHGIVTNYPFILGLLIYGVASVLLLIALKHGKLSVLYPFVSLSFVWVTLVSAFIFSESIKFAHWIGIASIIGGVCFLGYGESLE